VVFSVKIAVGWNVTSVVCTDIFDRLAASPFRFLLNISTCLLQYVTSISQDCILDSFRVFIQVAVCYDTVQFCSGRLSYNSVPYRQCSLNLARI
jgi:hypothetical protein